MPNAQLSTKGGDGEPPPVIGLRICVAVVLVMLVLAVVLLTCLLELTTIPGPSSSSGPGGPVMPGLPTATPLPCPDVNPALIPFPPNSQGQNVVLSNVGYLLNQSISVNTITITNGATLVIADGGVNASLITIRTKYILIQNQGALVIGSETCRYMAPLQIVLFGLYNDTDYNVAMGRKFVGVTATGSIDIHGPWKLSWTYLNTTIEPGSGNVTITLEDDASSWLIGDQIVIASSDYDMLHAEQFTIINCPGCAPNQISIQGPVLYNHNGQVTPGGVDVRAEVALLTRNIKIMGEMQSSCTNLCNFYTYDTHGGQMKIFKDATNVRIEGLELYHMGQQWITSQYPMHFHRVFDATSYYARQLSIHKSFSRCFTLHATQNLVVQDVVGYDTLGHCFFFSDGNEVNNTLIHNLGLVTRSGTILPADRNNYACVNLTANISNYIPNPAQDCNGVSTYWISHPNNTFVNNSAGGSEQMGFFFAFYRVPTGESAGLLPPFDGERSPLGGFTNNKAHSNAKAGFFMDRGPKTTSPSPADYRDLLALENTPRYEPHIDKSLLNPRTPANITQFTGYKNAMAMFVRGGDIWIDSARLSDNDLGLMMASSSSLPYDDGSHQQLTNSVVVGLSGSNVTDWAIRANNSVGVQIRDGPIVVEGNTFSNFTSMGGRTAYPIGFMPNNTGQYSVASFASANTFQQVSSKIFLGQPGGYFGSYNMDGDLNQIFMDADGSITGVPTGSYIVRPDNPLLMTSSCTTNSNSLTYCTNVEYGQLFLNVSSKTVNLTVSDVSNPANDITYSGLDKYAPDVPMTTQFQMVLIANHTYRMLWVGGMAPDWVDMSIYRFPAGSSVTLQFCYPNTTIFSFVTRQWNQPANTTTYGVAALNTCATSTCLTQITSSGYFWNSVAGVLYVKLVSPTQTNLFDYCPNNVCQFVTILANVTSSYSSCW